MGTRLRALAVLEVTIGRTDHTFALTEAFPPGIETHGAAALPPLKPSLNQNLIQTFSFRCKFNLGLSRHNDGFNTLCDMAAFHDLGDLTQVG